MSSNNSSRHAERFLDAFIGLLVGILVIVFLGFATLLVVGLYTVHPLLAWAGASILLICAFLGWRSDQ